MTAWDTEPALTEDELNEVLTGAALTDGSGFAPPDDDWSPTYDLNAAATKAWLIKAGKAAATVDMPEAGMVTSKVFDNCRTMARIYAGKRATTIWIR